MLQAATRVFARLGYRRASTAEIAREAGVSEAMIYKRFDSKKDLFDRVLRRVGGRILENWSGDPVEANATPVRSARSATRAGQPAPSRGNRLGRLARIYLQGVREHEDALAVQFQALAESEDRHLASTLRENHRAYVDFLARVITEEQARGTVRSDIDPVAAAWVLNGIGFTMTLIRLLALERDDRGRSVSELMVHAALDWLSTPSEPARATRPRRGRRKAVRDDA